MGGPGTPRREVVTGVSRLARPVRGPARSVPVRPADGAGPRELMRRQFRLGLAVFGVLVGVVGALPLVFAALPDPAVRPAGALVVWAVLGVGVYPLLVVVGRWYVVRAERNERDVADGDEGARR